jgi:hypothetical protein
VPEEPAAQDPPPAAPEPDTALTAALTAELGKKAGVCWLRYDGRDHAVWHVWLEGALYVLSGGDEQPLPGIEDQDRVEVVMRSKDSGGRLLRWVGEVSAVRPDDESWEPVTTALVSGRLNLPDLATAADGWAAGSRVSRVVPTGEVLDAPGRLPDGAHLAAPRPTRATTRGPLPRVLHRRARRGPGLS